MSSVIARTLRNVTSTAQKIDLPTGVKSVRMQYVDSGIAGPLRVVTEYASATDAAHRLTLTGAHLVVPSNARIPPVSVSVLAALYVRTDNAIGAGSNTLNILMEIE